MTRPAIEVELLSRWFGKKSKRITALHDVSLAVEQGTIVALLGPNGAGKTTLTKILATLLYPSSGSARLFGHDVVREARTCRRLASVVFGGERGLYPQLTGRDNLRFFGMLAGVKAGEAKRLVPELLEQVGLAEVAGRRVETYSKGMKQRLHIAIGFIPRPRILLLDEPTVGLDPSEAERLRQAVKAARDDGVTVLLTSHYLLDVERLADRVLLLDRGALIEDRPLSDFVLRAGYTAEVRVRGLGPPPLLPVELPEGIDLAHGPDEVNKEWALTLRVARWSSDVFAHMSTILAGAEVIDVDVQQVGLEHAFAQVTRGDI